MRSSHSESTVTNNEGISWNCCTKLLGILVKSSSWPFVKEVFKAALDKSIETSPERVKFMPLDKVGN